MAPPDKPAEPTLAAPTRSGSIAIVGRPNVGKSTFLNAALGVDLAIVSKTPQTTRQNLLGVVHRQLEDGTTAELCLLDTPGLHKGTRVLDKRMNRSARGAAEGADVVLFFTDVPENAKGALRVHPGDVTLLADIGKGRPLVLVVNKIDRVRDKRALLPLLEALGQLAEFAAIVPISALKDSGIELVLDEVAKHVPEGGASYGPDDLTDKPTRFFAAEFVREQILRSTYEEVPHGVAVSIDSFEQNKTGFRVAATIHVDQETHKKIIVGAGGQMLKRIGTAARLRLEELVGAKVYLELFVRNTPGWRDDQRLLSELGYHDGDAGSGSDS